MRPRGRLLRPALALAALLLALALVEGGLALAGVQPEASRTVEVVPREDGSLELLSFDRWRRRVEPARRAGARRTVLVGDSTFFGAQLAPRSTIARFLQHLLPRVAPGDHDVTTLAAPGLVARDVRALGELALAHLQPDLLIAYTGHNDLLPPHVDRALARRAAPLRAWIGERLSGTRLGAWLAGSALAAAADDAPRPWFGEGPGDGRAIRATSRAAPVRAELLDDFAAQLDALAGAAARAGVPLLLVVPVSNGREYGPLSPSFSVALDEPERARAAERLAAAAALLDGTDAPPAARLDGTGTPPAAPITSARVPLGAEGPDARALAAAALDEAEAIDPRTAPLLHLRGRLAWAAGDAAAARALDRRAWSLDDDPRVASADVLARLEQVAAARGVPLVDARERLERPPAPGEPRLFLDHCHPSVYGQYLMAAEIVRACAAHALLGVPPGAVPPPFDEALRLAGVPAEVVDLADALTATGDLVFALEAYDGRRYLERARATIARADPERADAPAPLLSADLVVALLDGDRARARRRAAALRAADPAEYERVVTGLGLRPPLRRALELATGR